MGNCCCKRKNYRRLDRSTSIEEVILQQLRRQVDEAENDSEKLDALTRLGNTYQDQDNFKDAIQQYEVALGIAKSDTEKFDVLTRLGDAHHSLCEFKQAIENHEKARDIAEKNGDNKEKRDANGKLGTDYYFIGDFKEARLYHRAELDYAKKVDDESRGEGQAYSHIGADQFCLKEFADAERNHEEHFKIAERLEDKREQGIALGNIGICLRKSGKFEDAKKNHKEELRLAKETGNKFGEANAYLNLGSAYRGLRKYKFARGYHWWGFRCARRLSNTVVTGYALYNWGRDLECMGSLEQAEKKYRSSVDVYNKVRNSLKVNDDWAISFRDSHQKAYIALWRTLSNLRRKNEALCSAEQGRAQALVDLLHLRHGVKEDDHSCEEVRSFISGDIATQTVFFAIESNVIHFWVIRDDNVEFRRTELNIATIVQRVVKSAHDQTRTTGNNTDSLRNMYDMIIKPIRDLLHDGDLIIVPDRQLFLVPYNALQEEGTPEKYLFESFRIRIIPSLTSLKLISDRSNSDDYSGTGVLLVGNPDHSTCTKLKYARKEVKCIKECLERREIPKVTVLIDEEATKKRVLEQMKSVELIHIAAHAHASGEIDLAGNDQLTMADVKRQGVKARLVVLSCCKSGQGEVTADGVVGIARAFLGAGARSVVATLWEIDDDEATVHLIEEFYKHLIEGDKAALSFQKAMRKFRSDVRHWVSFILIGDDVILELKDNATLES